MYGIDFSNRTYLDGGLGTLLQAAGLKAGERPESWNTANPDGVRRAHDAYLASGAEIIAANTFGATRSHMGDGAALAMREGVKLALDCVSRAGRGVAAIDMGGLGKLLEPYGDLPFEQAVGEFREAFTAGLLAGGQAILIETMTDQLEAKAAVIAAREAIEATGVSVPIFCSMCYEPGGRLLTGASVEGVTAMLAGLRVDVIGMNCGHEPRALYDCARRLKACSPLPVFVCPNASLPEFVQGKTVFPTVPEDFARQMRAIAELGVWGLGGCCGTTPEHIKALIAETRDIAPTPPKSGLPLTVSGRSATAVFGERPLVIGERLNPTGKPKLKQALREGDMDAIMREAITQTEAGADALDVNAGLPEIDEAAVLPRVIGAVQSVCELPLQIDTADTAALGAALRAYSGKPIINSVSGKRAVMDAVFPLAARYGGAIVALTLDERGIPDSVEGRMGIARLIVAEAAKHGIPKSELVFDALTMSAAADAQAARTTADTIRALKAELGVKTVLGVSNISFGLPQRPIVTAAFTALVAGAGIDAAIMNPSDALVRAMLCASAALYGRDEGFAGYIEAYAGKGKLALCEEDGRENAGAAGISGANAPCSSGSQTAQPAISAQTVQALAYSIKKGLSADARNKTEALLYAGESPMALIDGAVIPALNDVGAGYEKGALFLPQLLQAAAAAQSAFQAIRERMPADSHGSGRKVVLATVKGDVHDIGKNIVKVLLENYGFDVIDLGRDVPPEKVLEAAKQSGAALVGLSALMTTTVPAMRDTIALLRSELPSVKVMVGGAVLTPEYAAQIGADFYAPDAIGSVRIAEGVYAERD